MSWTFEPPTEPGRYWLAARSRAGGDWGVERLATINRVWCGSSHALIEQAGDMPYPIDPISPYRMYMPVTIPAPPTEEEARWPEGEK